MSLKGLSTLRALVVIGTAAAALSLAVPAGALDKVTVSGTIQFTPPSDFHGTLKSKQDACKAGARVNLLRYQNSNDTTGDVVGTDKSDRKGRWAIMVPNAQAGEFQLTILGRKVQVHDFAYKCKPFQGIRAQF